MYTRTRTVQGILRRCGNMDVTIRKFALLCPRNRLGSSVYPTEVVHELPVGAHPNIDHGESHSHRASVELHTTLNLIQSHFRDDDPLLILKNEEYNMDINFFLVYN